MAGFYLGLGICCILLAQPWLYIALGFSWLFTAFGRLFHAVGPRQHALQLDFDGHRTGSRRLPLAFSLGFVP